MKQKLFQNMLKAAGAFLFAVTMSAGFTACTDTIDNPATPVDPEEPERPGEEYVEPTEDAVEVTTNYSYAVFGNIDDEMGKAISRRLKGTPDVPSMAQLYFLDPQRGVDLGMGEEKWQELVADTLAVYLLRLLHLHQVLYPGHGGAGCQAIRGRRPRCQARHGGHAGRGRAAHGRRPL